MLIVMVILLEEHDFTTNALVVLSKYSHFREAVTIAKSVGMVN